MISNTDIGGKRDRTCHLSPVTCHLSPDQREQTLPPVLTPGAGRKPGQWTQKQILKSRRMSRSRRRQRWSRRRSLSRRRRRIRSRRSQRMNGFYFFLFIFLQNIKRKVYQMCIVCSRQEMKFIYDCNIINVVLLYLLQNSKSFSRYFFGALQN